MLLCAIPRPSKHANPPLSTNTPHYTILLVSYPRLAQALTLLLQFKDTHTYANTQMCYLLMGARNSLYWLNYNFVHYISSLLARLLLMQKAETRTTECQSVFKNVHQRRLFTFMSCEIYPERDAHCDLLLLRWANYFWYESMKSLYKWKLWCLEQRHKIFPSYLWVNKQYWITSNFLNVAIKLSCMFVLLFVK